MASVDRRTLLGAGLATVAGVAGGALSRGPGASAAGTGAPAWHPGGRPALTHGVQSGVAGPGAAVLWTRADRPGVWSRSRWPVR